MVGAIAFCLSTASAVIDPRANDPLLELLDERAVPYATLGRDIKRLGAPVSVVNNDKRAITGEALDGLHARGMRNVLLVMADAGQSYMTDVADAVKEWAGDRADVVAAVAVLPLPFRPRNAVDRVRQACREGTDTIYLAVEAALPAVLEGIAAAGCRIPEDVQVLATTDSTQAQLAQPPVSAVDLQPAALGQRLFGLLKARVGGDAADIDRIVTARFPWRDSTRPPDLRSASP